MIALQWQAQVLSLLDQSKYPAEEIWVDCNSVEDVAKALSDGTVREVYFYCVDISEFTANKLGDRGSLSAKGIVTNVQDFIVTLSHGLGL